MVNVWVRRAFSALGVVSVAPWLYVSVQGLRDDAPDSTYRAMVVLLVAQAVLITAFLVAWFQWRPGSLLAAAAVVGYAGAAAFAAADNGGSPVLAAVIFPLVPAIAAGAILVLSWYRPRPVPTGATV